MSATPPPVRPDNPAIPPPARPGDPAIPPPARPGDPAIPPPARSRALGVGLGAGLASLLPDVVQAAGPSACLKLTDHGIVNVCGESGGWLTTANHAIASQGLLPLLLPPLLMFFTLPALLAVVLWRQGRRDGGRGAVRRLWQVSLCAVIVPIYIPRIFSYDPFSPLGMAVAVATVLLVWAVAVGLLLEGFWQLQVSVRPRPLVSKLVGLGCVAASVGLLLLVPAKFSDLPAAISHAPGTSPFILLLSLLTLIGYNDHGEGTGLSGFLGRRAVSRIKAAGYTDLLEDFRKYKRLWYFRRLYLTLPLAIIMPILVGGDTLVSSAIVVSCVFLGQSLDRIAENHWTRYKSLKADERFRPAPTPHSHSLGGAWHGQPARRVGPGRLGLH